MTIDKVIGQKAQRSYFDNKNIRPSIRIGGRIPNLLKSFFGFLFFSDKGTIKQKSPQYRKIVNLTLLNS